MHHLKSLIGVTALSLLVAIGCQKSDPMSVLDTGNIDDGEVVLESEFGGYDASDEAPAFGDEEIISQDTEDAPSYDVMSAQPQVTDAISDASTVPAYFVRLAWGQLQGDSTITDATDWSGTISVNKGVLAVLKVVKFEGGDHLILPRENRQTLSYVSRTTVHFDGLALAIIDNEPNSSDVEGQLTINAGPYSQVFSFSELDSLELIESVDDLGNEYSITSRGKSLQHFPGGFFAGRWIKTAPNSGRFGGRWISADGDNIGHMRGRWGFNEAGRKALAGKIIDKNGQFIGLLAGHWGYSNSDRHHGWMKGRYVNRNRTELGRFHGVWRSGKPGDGKGFLHGRWTSHKVDSES